MKALKNDGATEKASHLKIVAKEEAAHHESSHDDMLMGGHSKKAEEGEGPWLVSYADMMTLLMGFFALMASMSKPDAKEFDKVAAATSKHFGGKYEAPYEKLGNSLTKVFKEKNIDGKVQVEINSEGVTLTFNGTIFFESGNYQIKEDSKDLLEKIATAVHKEAQSYNALIEGHTDNNPIKKDIIASNWELSAIRAARIAQYFETQGFKKEQLTIMGWGETKPVAPNNNSDGTPNLLNQSKNRRVLIRIYKDLPN